MEIASRAADCSFASSVDELGPGRRREDLPRTLGREVAGEFGVERQRVPGEDRHADAGSCDAEIGQLEDLAALIAELLLLVRLAVAILDEVAREGDDIEGDGRHVLLGCGEFDGAAIVHEVDRGALRDGGLDLTKQLLCTGEP